MTTLTVERLHELLSYDPATGDFWWRTPPSNRCDPSLPAGAVKADSGYRAICIDWRKHYAHRLAWLYVTGTWPAAKIDHRNGNRDDNRWENLRLATDALNAHNRTRLDPRNTSGVTGVCPSRGRWKAQICAAGRNRFLGRFDTVDEARAAYLAAKVELHEG